MSEILKEIKESFIKGLKRERTEKERLLSEGMFWALIILLWGSVIVLAVAPVHFSGDIQVQGEFNIVPTSEFSTINNTTINNITLRGDFTAPSYIFSKIMR